MSVGKYTTSGDEDWYFDMALLGNLGAFTSTDAGDWKTYLSRLDQFYKANKIEDNRKKAVFLSVIGDSCFRLLETLVAPAEVDSKTLSDLRDILSKHFTPKRIVIAERYRFWNRAQHAGESYLDYAAELRRLARYCDFGANLEDTMRDRFVCGIRDAAVCKKLLTNDTLTMEEALKTASAQEIVDREAATLTSGAGGVHAVKSATPAKHKQSKPASKAGASGSSSSGGKSFECYRCGSIDHAPANCKFKTAECHHCHKKGHLSRVCRTRLGEVKWISETPVATHSPEVLSAESKPSPTTAIKQKVHSVSPWTIPLEVDGVMSTFVIDTGAAVTLMPRRDWEQNHSKALEQPDMQLRSYTENDIVIEGKANVEVVHKGKTITLPLYIVDGPGPALLGRNWLEQVKLDWATVFGVEEELNLTAILEENAELFDGNLGELNTGKAHLTLKDDARPVFHRPRSLPYATKPAVEAELDRMERQGIIESVQTSNWATPVVPVPKPDGSVRLCGDYRVTVNKQLKVDQHPLPKPKDIFSSLNQCTHFAKLDLSQAYLQVPLDEESQEITTITTHKGLYRFKRLPYGIASAPAVFQSVMDKVLSGIEGVSKYLDDILIAARTRRLLLQRLNTVLSRLRMAGLKLKKTKCTFLSDSVHYLGFRIDATGLHATKEKVQAVQDAPVPTSVTEVRAFMGLVNYYGQFLENLATTAQPLYQLMKDNQPWKWTKTEQEAFEKLKHMLSEPPVLIHYDPDLPVRLACDASGTGIGAVLSHILPGGKEQPIAFASRTLSSAERNYSQLEREALGIIFGVTKFHEYIYGRHFTLVTDNQPLAVILGPKRGIPPIAAMRLQRWAVILAAYNYDVVVKSTAENANADCMSRLSLPCRTEVVCEVSAILSTQQSQLPVLAADIRDATAKDSLLKKVVQYVQAGWPKTVDPQLQPYQRISAELTVEQGCLQRGVRTVIPTCLRPRLLEELHVAHPGIVRMKALARSHIWWPQIDEDIEKTALDCNPCQANRNKDAPVPVTSWPWPTTAWSRIHADFAGPMEGQMYLIITDAHSKWLEVIHMSTTSSKATIAVFQRLFDSFGIPHAIVTDNGTQFTSLEWKNFMKCSGIIHMRSAPYFPATNGAAERSVQTFKAAVVPEKRGNLSVYEATQQFLRRYRATPHATTGKSPASLFLKREIRTRLDLVNPDQKPAVDEALQERVHEQQAKQTQKSSRKSENKHVAVGDAVYARIYNRQEKWLPGVVKRTTGAKSVEVLLNNGILVRRHLDQIRTKATPIPEQESEKEVVMQQARTRSQRSRRLPVRFRDDSDK